MNENLEEGFFVLSSGVKKLIVLEIFVPNPDFFIVVDSDKLLIFKFQ